MASPDGALPASADPFRSLVEAVTDYALYTIDLDGIVQSWNPGAERIKGYGADEIIGRHFEIFFTQAEQAAGRPAASLAAARRDGRYETEGWRVRKDGSLIWASVVIDTIRDENNQLSGFAKITRDVSDRHAAEEALRQSERRFRLLMNNVVQFAIYTVDLDGCMTSWNPGAERVKGYTQDEVLGRHFSMFFTDDDRDSGKPDAALATARATGRFEDEGWRVRRDGTRFWASVVMDAMHDEGGRLVGYAKVTRDVTERRALEQARAQLYQAQKLETIGQLTGGVAHDFNNLLTAISASLELILHGRNDEARTRELAAIALAASQRGATLVGQMLSYARRQSLRPKPCNVNDLIERIETLLRRTAGDLIGWRCRLDPLVWLADLDQAHFESALMNLVVNARDAMKQGGQLTLESRNFVVDEAYAADLGDIAPGNYVVVTVRDTGSGMAPEVRARAIEPFYTTKDVGAGSGLGLSQVYGFVRQSNGQIAIESTPGEGTAVNLYLPQSREVQHAAAAAPDTDIAFGNGSVLVVEDDPEVLHIAASAIRSFGYHVHRAGDAAAALTVLRAAPKVDLLFTDIVMPGGMSGVELAREACRRYPNLRVLLASGYARDVLEAQESMHDGMAFIAKPYALSALSAMVRTLVS